MSLARAERATAFDGSTAVFNFGHRRTIACEKLPIRRSVARSAGSNPFATRSRGSRPGFMLSRAPRALRQRPHTLHLHFFKNNLKKNQFGLIRFISLLLVEDYPLNRRALFRIIGGN